MVSPINYMTQAANPIGAALQGLQGGMGIAQQAMGMQQAQEKQQRQQQFRQESYALSQNPNATAKDYVDLQAKYPEFAEGIKALNSARSDAQVRGDLNVFQKVNAAIGAGKPEQAVSFLKEYSTALENSGRADEAQQAKSIADMAEKDPQSVKSATMNMLLGIMGPEQFLKVYQQREKAIGAEKVHSGKWLPNGAFIGVTNLGNRIVRDMEGNELTGQAAADMIEKAQKEYGIDLKKMEAEASKKGALGVEAEMKPSIEAEVTRKKKQAESEEVRDQGYINQGLIAGDALPTIKRSIELLKGVKTGGFSNTLIRVKQFFGVEGADEGELSYNLSKNVIGQLKDMFGGAFSKEEAKWLERAEAGLGRNNTTNLAILNQALKKAERNIRKAIITAKKKGDMNAVQELNDLMNFSLNPNASTQQTTELMTQPSTTQDLKNQSTADLFQRFQNTMRP